MPRTQRRLGYRLAVLGFLAIAGLTLMPNPSQMGRVASTPVSCIICGDTGSVDFSLNILLFFPLGLGLALAGFSWRRVLLLSALLTSGVELLQMKVIPGRDASLGDLIANTLGGGLGALVAAHWRALLLPDRAQSRRLALACASLLCAAWWGAGWALAPALPNDSPWYGGWAPEMGNFDLFAGRVLEVTAGGEPLLPGSAIDQARIVAALTADHSIAFRAILGPRPHRLAPIALVVDGRQRDVIFLGQERPDLSFALRSRASTVKLKSPRVNLKGGLDGQVGDTVRAAGALRDNVFELRSESRGQVKTRRLPLSASWGWSLFVPGDSVLGEEVHFLTAVWIAGLIALVMYWGAMAGGAALAVAPATVGILLGVVPLLAGFQPVHLSEWMAGLGGAAVGTVAAIAARRVQASPAS